MGGAALGSQGLRRECILYFLRVVPEIPKGISEKTHNPPAKENSGVIKPSARNLETALTLSPGARAIPTQGSRLGPWWDGGR